MSNRADLQTSTKKQLTIYSDFTRNLDCNKMSGQLAKLINEAELKDTIGNLILIDQFEIPYSPLVGSQIQKLLFEPCDSITATTINTLITETLQNNISDRINVISVEVTALPNEQQFKVTITFTPKNSAKNLVFQTILQRVR